MNIRGPLVLLVVLAMAGCGNIGPGNMSRDRFDYMGTVAESWKSQMLQNLVKLRYGDTPVFMDVGAIVANYSFQRSVTAGGLANIFNNGTAPGIPSGNFSLSAQGVYTDTPTITYVPLQGERFARSMMMPLPVSAVLNVLQGGYPVDFVFRLTVQSINAVDNRRVQLQQVRPADPEFYALIKDLNRIQASGEVGIHRVKTEGEEKLELIFRPRIAAAIGEAVYNVKNILGLDPDAQKFQVVYGAVPTDDKEIAIVTRSILEVLTDLSSGIDVPDAHVTKHMTGPTPEADLGPDGPILNLIRITSSAERPENAFVTTPYREYWFSIDDHDLRSKRLFTFLMFLFTFVETPGTGSSPVLTIPTSR